MATTTIRLPTLVPFLRLPDLPASARGLLGRLVLAPPSSLATLANNVALQRLRIEKRGRRDSRVDVALGTATADALTRFLARADARCSPDALAVIHAVVRFFVIDSDDGFVDDARVVNAMLRWFGRDDLMIALPAPAVELRPHHSVQPLSQRVEIFDSAA